MGLNSRLPALPYIRAESVRPDHKRINAQCGSFHDQLKITASAQDGGWVKDSVREGIGSTIKRIRLAMTHAIEVDLSISASKYDGPLLRNHDPHQGEQERIDKYFTIRRSKKLFLARPCNFESEDCA